MVKFVELNFSAVDLSVKPMVFLITGSLLHVYRLLCILHAFKPVVTWALAPVNILKKRMLGPGFRNQDCKTVVRPAVWVLVTGVVLPAVEQQ